MNRLYARKELEMKRMQTKGNATEKKGSLKSREAQPQRVGMQQQATLPGRQRGGDYGHVVYYFPRPPSSMPAGVT